MRSCNFLIAGSFSIAVFPFVCSPKSAAQTFTQSRLDPKLIGTWRWSQGNREERITFTAKHTYVRRYGASGFRSGYYEERGGWEILRSRYLSFEPEWRKDRVNGRIDRKLAKEVRQLERVMDEGAWKPADLEITFFGPNKIVVGPMKWAYVRLPIH